MSSIRPILEAADRSLALDIKRRATIGHLRSVARDIASHLYGVSTETGEVVALQDRFEAALGEFVKAMASPAAAIAYVAPDAARARITAMSESAKAALSEGEASNSGDKA